jgi:hypothetical protein
MSSSNNLQPWSMVLHYELDLFYDTPVVCSCSKCKELKKISRHVTLSHYINDRLPKVDGLIPPIAVKNPIGDVEKTHRNTSICCFFEKLEARSTKFCSQLANPSFSIESMESSSEPKYDINTTQNISTSRSKKLYEIRAKMSKYTRNYVELLEGSDDFPLPIDPKRIQRRLRTAQNSQKQLRKLIMASADKEMAKIISFQNLVKMESSRRACHRISNSANKSSNGVTDRNIFAVKVWST